MRRATGVALLVLGLGASCGGGGPATEASAPSIDEERGSINGVALGDAPSVMLERFGEGRRGNIYHDAAIPLSVDIGDWQGPTAVGSVTPDRETKISYYRYEHTVFFFENDALTHFETNEPGAVTSRGVAIGNSLAEVRRLYVNARCGRANPEDASSFRACIARPASRRWLWFGGDPITTITVSVAELSGV